MVNPALEKAVVGNSRADSWDEAHFEWTIIHSAYDPECTGECVGGKRRIADEFTIQNDYTRDIIEPIGNERIRLFDRNDFKERSHFHADVRKCQKANINNNGVLSIKDLSKHVIGAAALASVFSFREKKFLVEMKGWRRKRSSKQESWMQDLIRRLSTRLYRLLELPSHGAKDGRVTRQ